MGPHLDDSALIAGSSANPQLFAGIYERHGTAVRLYAARRVGQDHAEDIASEVFVRAFRGRDGYRAERSVALPWLLGIANHVIADHRRLERRRLTGLQRLAHETPAPGHEPDAGFGSELAAGLRGLPAVERDTLLLVVWGELSLDEAAEALGIPVGTVSSRIARARGRLTKRMRPAPTGPPTDLRLHGDANA